MAFPFVEPFSTHFFFLLRSEILKCSLISHEPSQLVPGKWFMFTSFFSLSLLLAAFSTPQVVDGVIEAEIAPFFSIRTAAAAQDQGPLSNTAGNKKDQPPIHAPL